MSEEKKDIESYSFRDFLTGKFLTEKFVSKQLKLLVLIVILIVIFISNSYSCMKKLAEIEKLKTELEDVKNKSRDISATLTSDSRYSRVKALVDQKGINLSSPTTPAFEIQK